MIIKLTQKTVIADRIREVGELVNVPENLATLGKIVDSRKPEEIKKQNESLIKSIKDHDSAKQDAIPDNPKEGKSK